MLTFSNPMAWLLVVALVITWSAVAVVLFDLLDYKTLTGKCLELLLKVVVFFTLIFTHVISLKNNSIKIGCIFIQTSHLTHFPLFDSIFHPNPGHF